VYIASKTDSFGQEQYIYDALLLKYDTDGNLQWARTWGGNWIEHVCGVGIDAEGNVYVGGLRAAMPYASWDVYILKYSPDGELLHAINWDSGQMDFVKGLAVSGNGDCYIVGEVNGESASDRKALVVSFDKNGLFRWARLWETGGEYGQLEGVAAGTDGLLRCAGYCSNNGLSTPLLLTFNGSGALLQDRLINSGLGAIAYDVAVDETGHLFLSGLIASPTGEHGDAFLISCNPNGDLQYADIWSSIEGESANAIAVDHDENLYLAGFAANISGTWGPLQVTLNAAQGVISPLDGETTTLSETETVPEGVITWPEGVQDTGGGGYYGYDALILKNYPH
jgi:hypothetical protein